MGQFDDLIPAQSGIFDDLIPKSVKQASFVQPEFKGQYPNTYAALKTASDMIPYAEYLDPDERDAFMKLSTQEQTNKLLKNTLDAELLVAFPKLIEGVGNVIAPTMERFFPKTYKFWTKERGVKTPEVKPTEVKPETPVETKPIGEVQQTGTFDDLIPKETPIQQTRGTFDDLIPKEVKAEPIAPIEKVEPAATSQGDLLTEARKYKTAEEFVKADKSNITKAETVNPETLTFREEQQHRTANVREMFDPEDMPPITVTDSGMIIDGHNRTIIAKEDGININTISIPKEIYNKLKRKGFDDIEISYAMLRDQMEVGYADNLNRQFPGANVQKEGFKALDVIEAEKKAQLTSIWNKAQEGKGTAKNFKEFVTSQGYKYPDSISKTPRPMAEFAKINKAKLKEDGKVVSDLTSEWNSKQKNTTLYSGIDPTKIVDVMKSISAKTSEIYESVKTPPSITEGVGAAKDAMIEHHRSIRSAESTSKLLEKTVNDIVPDKERQMMMVHAYEHKLKGKEWDGLTEIEKGVVRWLGQEKYKLGKYIKDNDIFETMPPSEDINHIYHSWINPETGEPFKAMYGKFSKGLPQAKQRTIPDYTTGIEKGMTPTTTNLGKLVGMEIESVTRANNARQLFKTLHGIKGDENMSFIRSNGGSPKPIRMIEGWSALEKQGLTEGYIRYDSPFLDKTMTFLSSDGRLVSMKGAVGVKEELYPFVHGYIDNPTYGKLSELNFAAKSLKLGASFFHVVSLGMQEVANMRIPFVHIPKGLKIIKELGPEVRLLHQEGLELFKGYEDLGYQDKFFDGISGLSKVGNAVTWPITKMRDFIFGVVQPGMKASFADMQFRKLLPQYLKNTNVTAEEVMKLYEQGKPLPKEALQCAREVVQKADGHFSGEDYKRSLLETNRFIAKLYFTPEARVRWQAALLSPTWQREHLIVAKNVAKSFMPDNMIKKLGLSEMGPIKSQYRKYLLGAIMMVGAVDLWNYQSTQYMDGQGKHLWENPKGKGFAVRGWWDEPAYTDTNKKGQIVHHPSAPSYIRPLKSVFEVAEWTHDPVLKVSYKLSPVVTAIGEQMFGYRKYEGLPDIPQRTWDFITDGTMPIVAGQMIKTMQGKQSVEATVLPFFGMPVSKLNTKKKYD